MPDGLRGVCNLRAAFVLVVAAVAAFAAIQSYSHIYWMGSAHGENHVDSALLPLSVDGLILAMTLLVLHEARAGRRAYWLGYVMLWLGIGATVGANVVYGWRSGPDGIAASAWPALAFVGAVHVSARALRTWHDTERPGERKPRSAPVARNALDAARRALEVTVAAGNPLSQRQLITRFGIGRDDARGLHAALVSDVAGTDGPPVPSRSPSLAAATMNGAAHAGG